MNKNSFRGSNQYEQKIVQDLIDESFSSPMNICKDEVIPDIKGLAYIYLSKKILEMGQSRKIKDEHTLDYVIKINSDDFCDMVSGLVSMHAGDCVCLPCPCDRCSSEAFFNIEYSANWETAYKGSELFSEFSKDKSLVMDTLHGEAIVEDRVREFLKEPNLE